MAWNLDLQPHLRRNLLRLAIVGVIVVFVFPIYWMFVSSIKPLEALFTSSPSIVPDLGELTLANYERLLFETPYLTWMSNSIVVALGNMILCAVLSTATGYALTRIQFRQKKNIARGILFVYMFPPVLLGIPYYALFFNLGLMNSNLGLVLAHAAITLPFTTWLMWQYFQTIPVTWEECAWVYGAPRLRAMWDVAIPNAAPGIIAVMIFAFAVSWNDYTFALILTNNPDSQLLTVGITQFIEGTRIHWGILMAASAILVLPALLLIFVLNKYLLEGFQFGS